MDRRPALSHDAWHAWPPHLLKQHLAGVGRPWCVVGGWALDLWHGRETRFHDDIEFTVLRQDLAIFRRALGDMAFFTAHDGALTFLPAEAEPGREVTQIWCEDIIAGCWRADMMIEDGTPETWVYKRDPTIRQPRANMVRISEDGIPYLRPAAALFFKAKAPRPKDEADFRKALPKLEPSERAWLACHLRLCHPGHTWTEALRRAI